MSGRNVIRSGSIVSETASAAVQSGYLRSCAGRNIRDLRSESPVYCLN
jgi:hypothetical protein